MERDSRLNEDLQRLLDRLAAGDESAVAALIERSVERLRFMAHTRFRKFPRVRRLHETDDVLNDAAMRLVRALRAVRPTSPSAFLGLAGEQIRRELIDLARHEYGPQGQGAHHASGPVPGEAVADPAAGPATEVTWRDLLRHCQDALTGEEREVFDRVHLMGQSKKEVANQLDMPVITVKRRWRSALIRLGEAAGIRPSGT
jgi:RNA polymerase sigma factor (sigma-70 family)